jgi:hypothetical protein
MFKLYAAIAVAVAAMIATVAIGYAVPNNVQGDHGGEHGRVMTIVQTGVDPTVPAPVFLGFILDGGHPEYVPVVFLRDPEHQDAANINIWRPIGAPQPPFHSVPRVIEGFTLADPTMPAPGNITLALFQNPVGESVPVWFVERSVLAAAAADELVFVPELDVPTTLKGQATQFHYLALPPQTNPNPIIQIAASGVLPDDSLFQLNLQYDINAQSFTTFNLQFIGQ